VRLILSLSVLIAAILCMAGPDVCAQDPHYKRYTFESRVGLPSNEVYGILFDKNHVLWAVTDRGIWSYDGNNSRQFTVAEGLKENSNFRIFTDAGGAIWASSINNYIYRITGDSARPYPENNVIHSMAAAGEYIQQILVNPDSSLLLCYNRPGLYKVTPGKGASLITEHHNVQGNPAVAIHYTPESYYWDQILPADSTRAAPPRVWKKGDWFYISCHILDPSNSARKSLYPLGDDSFLFSCSKQVFYIKDGALKSSREFKQDIITVFADEEGSFWIGLEGQGAVRFMNSDLNSTPVNYLISETVSGITRDYQGSYWFSTTTNGIYQAITLDIPVYEIKSLDEQDNIITSVTSDSDFVYLGTQSGRLFKASPGINGVYRMSEIELLMTKGPIRKMFITPDDHMVLFNGGINEITKQGRHCGLGHFDSYPYEYLSRPDGLWLASMSGRIMVFKDGANIRTWDDSTLISTFGPRPDLTAAIKRVRAMEIDSSGRFWVGTQNAGLYSSKDSVIYSWAEKDTLFGKRIHDISLTGRNVWVSIADYGIAVIRPDSTYLRITRGDGLSSDIIDLLFTENDSVVWAGTNNGLNRIALDPVTGSTTITHFTTAEGLPSNRIHSITRFKNNLWIGTSKGAVQLPCNFLTHKPFKLQLGQCRVIINDKPDLLTPDKSFNPNNNNLVFKFNLVDYLSPQDINYRYKLEGTDENYIDGNNPEARYPDLRYGRYTFRYNASFSGLFDESTEKQISFQIRRHWYETKVAFAGYFLFGLGLLLLVFKLVLGIIRMREDEKHRLLLAEKRSLLAQMNPHFIFNSLNSIQHFIIQHDEMQANNYLTNFSGLIRRILDNSKKNLIPLTEEISALTLYLGMEKLRFENEFEFEIVKDTLIDYHETMIPPMLIQPFVENAIWHGLLPMKAPGTLTITFSDCIDFYQCRIEDNGIGREKAMSLKRKKDTHVSSGIRNVEERIELLNKTNRKKIHLIITDLHQPDGSAMGTLVELFLPKDLKS
jgi:ligand-binding sensor domain-containing protein